MTHREQRISETIADAPTSARGILKRAFEGSGGRKNAIAAMCLHCTGYDRETVRNCTGWSCPLWQWRPFQSSSQTPLKSGVAEEEKEAAAIPKGPAA